MNEARSQPPLLIVCDAFGSCRSRPMTAPKNNSATATVFPAGAFDDRDAKRGGNIKRDVIHANTSASDDLQLGCRLQEFGGDARRAAPDDGVVLGNPSQQLFARQCRYFVDDEIGFRREQREAFRIDVVGYEHTKRHKSAGKESGRQTFHHGWKVNDPSRESAPLCMPQGDCLTAEVVPCENVP